MGRGHGALTVRRPRTRDRVHWTLVTAATLALAACTAAPAPTTPPGTATPQPAPTLAPTAAPTPVPTAVAAAPTAVAEEFDRLFIDMMVPHHEGALEMARIALERAERPEIKRLAEDILRSQDEEIARMRQWRQQWYGSPETPPMSRMPMLRGMEGMGDAPHAMDMAKDVEQLRLATGPFDAAFIDAMVPHHQSGIDAARLALRQASRPEIRNLALDIIDAQLREIGEMRRWRTAWYGGPPGTTVGSQGPGGPAEKPEVRDVADEHAGH